MATDTAIYLRAPNAVRFASPACVLPPPLKWLSGTWKLTSSTLPRWRKARDVTINYALIPSPAAITGEEISTLQYGTQLEDFMFWQEPCGPSVTYRSAMGLSKPIRPGGKANGELTPDLYGDTFHHGERTSLVYTRRGNGWSRLIRQGWEILGYGIHPPSPYGQEHICSADGNSWIVIYVAKTPMAPAGLNILCRFGQLPDNTVDAIRLMLTSLGHDMTALAERLFSVPITKEMEKT